MLVNEVFFVSHIGAGADMELVIDMWKNTTRKAALVFPQYQQPKRIGLLIIGKTPG